MRVEVRIDGRSELHLRSNEVWWHHFENAAPGRHGGTTPIKVNLIDWLPTWPDVPTSENRDCYCDSSHLTAGFDPLAAVDQTVTFNVLQGQGRATMTAVQQPAAGNGHTFILQIDDNGYGGSFVYIVELTYLTPAG